MAVQFGTPGVVLREELESVHKRAARFMTGNYNYETGSMTDILGQLKWEKKSRKDNRLTLLYKDLKGKASIPTDRNSKLRGTRLFSSSVLIFFQYACRTVRPDFRRLPIGI